MNRKVNKKRNLQHRNSKHLKLSVLALGLVGLLVGVVFSYSRFEPQVLARLAFYIELANPSVKVVPVIPGLRKEQVADVVAKKLGWNESEKQEFLDAHLALNTLNIEGKYLPKTYLIDKDANPLEVSETMLEEFEKKFSKIEKNQKKKNNLLNKETVVKIASIIEREAAGKEDARLISGIIWNRIWLGMKLEIDATLQYAKGTEEDGWWPKVVPEDKKIDSEYNTYKHEGLPPSPIANPSVYALEAAYNPEKTECIFYLHDKNRKIHCAETYEEHKKNIEKYY